MLGRGLEQSSVVIDANWIENVRCGVRQNIGVEWSIEEGSILSGYVNVATKLVHKILAELWPVLGLGSGILILGALGVGGCVQPDQGEKETCSR